MARTATPSRPLIGINCDFYNPKLGGPFARVNTGYFDSVLAAGGLPILLPPLRKDNFSELEALLDLVSGVVMVGGMDLDPRGYGQPVTNAVQPMPAHREENERYLLTKVIERKLPLVAIEPGCNSSTSTLAAPCSSTCRSTTPAPCPTTTRPAASTATSSTSSRAARSKRFSAQLELRVNSARHQAINKVGKRLASPAKSPNGIIEAVGPPKNRGSASPPSGTPSATLPVRWTAKSSTTSSPTPASSPTANSPWRDGASLFSVSGGASARRGTRDAHRTRPGGPTAIVVVAGGG